MTLPTAIHRRARRTRSAAAFLLLALLLPLAGCAAGTDAGDAGEYQPVADALSALIRDEMEEKGIPAISIALVDDQEIVWAEGFGYAQPEDSVPATASTVYRVGSVSKLFTDIGIMRLVEKGEIDLDAPVSTYLPEFAPENPFGGDITLRQLTSHRAGLVREPAVGSYFAADEPTLAATVESISGSRLFYAPEERTKYSNAGIAVVGYVLEQLSGQPFVEYLQADVLDPMGLENSAFHPRPDLQQRLATAFMWTYDDRMFEAPTFQLGMAPAGSMYSTVEDLGRFMSLLFAGGTSADGTQVLRPETIEAMWTPQFAAADATTGYGIGFRLGEVDGRRTVGHGGAIYGFATQLQALPEEKLGVVVVSSLDFTNPVVGRIADEALRMMLAVRADGALPAPADPEPLDAARAKRLEGVYGTGDDAVELLEFDGRLWLQALRGGDRVELRAAGGDTLITDGRLGWGTPVLEAGDAIVLNGERLARAPQPKPQPVPAEWQSLIGEYGPDYNILYILERDGELNVLIEWFEFYPLRRVSANVWAFPDYGSYPGEELVFTRAGSGRATSVALNGIAFDRRDVGTEAGVTFKIEPVRPVDELREAALAASPPEEEGEFRQPDLVELTDLDPTIQLDVRYATTNNFMGAVFYQQPRAFMQRPAAEAVVRAHRKLKERGFGLHIFDAYRPWYVTKMFWDATPGDMKIFVADPSAGSRHNRGAAVDLTLFDLRTGQPVGMVSGYDEFSPRAFPKYPGEEDIERWHREVLREAMEAEGFQIYEFEWWHFDYGEWRQYPIGNITFEEIP